MVGIRKRSTSPGHGQDPMTKEMTKATIMEYKLRALDAGYNALVGGKEGRKKDKAQGDRRVRETQKMFNRRKK